MTSPTIAKKSLFSFLAVYFGLRIFSYFFQPDSLLNNLIASAILIAVIYFLSKKDQRGWYIVVGEIMLGGAGNFLSSAGISLRTWLLVFLLTVYFLQNIKNLKQLFGENRQFIYLLGLLYLVVIVAFGRGYWFGHSPKEIISNTIPYLFFLYYFPLKQLLASEKFKQLAGNLLVAAVAGNFIFTIFTFIIYSAGVFHLQDAYYHWFRDVANGKITGYDFNYYRIFLNDQLLLVPVFLWLFWKVLASPPFQGGARGGLPSIQTINTSATPSSLPLGKGEMITAITALMLLVILSVNITRIYILALAVGLLFLFSKTNWKRWLVCSACTVLLFFSSFTIIHTIASRGQSLGWEFFGLRLQSIAMPQIENSSLSRMMLLPKILEKIKARPLLGNGLGDTVTVFSPIDKISITTPQFDWGWLEIIDELGIVGLIIWILVIGYLILKIKQNRGLLASVVALLVINITSPALFHVLGVILIVYFLSANKEDLLIR